jgi:hypothetical protein
MTGGMGTKSALRSGTALMCAVVLVEFGLFEGFLRIKGGTEASPEFQRLFTPDPSVGYRLKAGATARFVTADFDTRITINQAGVRDREVGPKRPGERRVIVLGDSLVMAVQVPIEQTFTAQLEMRLAREAGKPAAWRVINAGVQGYGPVEEYLFYREIAARMQPDVVVLALYAGNDAVEAAVSASRLDGGQAKHDAPTITALDRFTQWRRRQIRRSVVLQVARLRAKTLIERFGWRPEIDPPLRTYLVDAPPEVGKGIAVTRDVVSRLSAFTASHGARLVVLLMPARFQIDDGDYGRLKEIVERSGKRLERDRATVKFKAALADLGVPVVDALPGLREADRESAVFMQSTAHLTPFGHQAVAGILDRGLRDAGLTGSGDR